MKPFAAIANQIQTVLRQYAADGLFTHADAGFGQLGKGLLTTSRVAPDERTIYDLASLTKALVTTPLVFAAARGNVALTLGDLFRHPPRGFRDEILTSSLRQILRHEAGLPAWRNFYVDVLSATSPAADIGSRHNLIASVFERSVYPTKSHHGPPTYSDIGFIALGMALEDYYGKNLQDVFSSFCSDIGFSPVTYLGYGPVAPSELAIPTGSCALRGRSLVGEVWDENCAALGGQAGHAGLFGTIEDLSAYLECLLSSEVGRDMMAKNHAELKPAGESLLGWRQGADPSAAGFGKGQSAGHLGFTGTAFWLAPDGTYSILLTNRVISGRINPSIRALRRQVFEIYGRI